MIRFDLITSGVCRAVVGQCDEIHLIQFLTSRGGGLQEQLLHVLRRLGEPRDHPVRAPHAELPAVQERPDDCAAEPGRRVGG